MTSLLRALLTPFNLPVLLTWTAVWLALPYDGPRGALVWTAMLGFLVTALLSSLAEQCKPPVLALWFGAQSACALVMLWLAPRGGVTPALLVILAAQLAMAYPPRTTLWLVAALNLALYAILRHAGVGSAPVVVAAFLGFQAFAALTAHFARGAENARDRLALVNADLLATRALLADSARDAERLRVARELHDVAGHKLTAIRLNLRALLADPALAHRGEVRLLEALSGELLEDLREVVQTLRDSRGLELATALRALAAPLPRPALRLRIDDTVRISDPALAETILRIVQEALTNAARHAQARTLSVRLRREADALHIEIEDDGLLRGAWREGNGLAGMRERVAARGGTLRLAPNERGALRIEARLPDSAAAATAAA
ncbi:sensor histidine kinase [Luteimonas aquatica]|uniref:sensor histidine kinase n=1 Tax=Luteimonas aquatica TaxID=450364 RepID=UPI001F591C27|nr:histidine kinase [Luteimonas aquatica]